MAWLDGQKRFISTVWVLFFVAIVLLLNPFNKPEPHNRPKCAPPLQKLTRLSEDRVFLTVLLHTSKATWGTRVQAIKDTWLSERESLNTSMRVLWVTDDKEMPDTVPHIVISNSPRPGLQPEPTGAMNERVVQSFIKALREDQPASDWYLKVDDDTYVNITNIAKGLSKYPDPQSQPYYVGNCFCSWSGGLQWCRDQPAMRSYFSNCSAAIPADGKVDDMPKYNCGGAGYLLSGRAAEMFVKYEKEVGAPRMYEDMMVGWTMMMGLEVPCSSPGGIFLEHGPSAHALLPDKEMCAFLGTFHKALPETMRHVYNLSVNS